MCFERSWVLTRPQGIYADRVECDGCLMVRRFVLADWARNEDEVGRWKEGSSGKEGAEGTLVVNRFDTESKSRTAMERVRAAHELSHIWTECAMGRRMAMRTICPALQLGHRNGSCPPSCRQRSR
jgi:hypothetical protein